MKEINKPKAITKIVWWFFCKIQSPIHSPSLGDKTCLNCKLKHGDLTERTTKPDDFVFLRTWLACGCWASAVMLVLSLIAIMVLIVQNFM